jgi:hypothetical protein
MAFPLVDRNNSSKTLIIIDGGIKGVAGQKPYLSMSKNSLDKEEDESMISFENVKIMFSCRTFSR